MKRALQALALMLSTPLLLLGSRVAGIRSPAIARAGAMSVVRSAHQTVAELPAAPCAPVTYRPDLEPNRTLSQILGPVTVPTVVRTERVGQLTGNQDPDNLPALNSTTSGEWKGVAVEGVDLGANTEHNGRLYIFFGDAAPGIAEEPPTANAENPGIPLAGTDLVAWTDDTTLRPGGFTLHPVTAELPLDSIWRNLGLRGPYFDPFSIDSGIGSLPRDRTPAGAFSYRGKVYVFALRNDPQRQHDPGKDPFPTAVLASKEDPSQPGPYHLEFKFSEWKFWSPQPVVVKNAEHPGLLPSTEGDGLVILGGGAFNEVHLAWMKLDPVRGPLLSSVRYYTGNAEWSRPTEWAVSGGMDAEDQARANPAAATVHEAEVSAVVNLPPRFSSVSATWLPGPKQWMLLYSTAGFDADHPDQQKPTLPIVARFGPNPWTWSDEVEVFNPCRDRAYGHFMHWPGLDDIDRRVPPTLGSADAWAGEPGHAYGAFVLQRFTRWDAASKELSLAYLLSTFNPYQVQVMRTQLRLPVTMASSDPLPGASAGAILAEVQPPATLTASEVLPGASARAVLSELQQPTPTPVAYHAPSIISGWPQLSTLTQGEAVTSLQYLLQQSGATLAVDGKFGPQTDAAVRAFQQAKALGVDGIVGPNTWQALIVYLQQGDHGPAVRAVQSQLKSRGLALTVDGDFGAQTDAVVKAYQQSHDLTVDGQVGPQTWPVLLSGK